MKLSFGVTTELYNLVIGKATYIDSTIHLKQVEVYRREMGTREGSR